MHNTNFVEDSVRQTNSVSCITLRTFSLQAYKWYSLKLHLEFWRVQSSGNYLRFIAKEHSLERQTKEPYFSSITANMIFFRCRMITSIDLFFSLKWRTVQIQLVTSFHSTPAYSYFTRSTHDNLHCHYRTSNWIVYLLSFRFSNV